MQNPFDRNTGGLGYNKLDFLSRLNPSEAHDTFEGLSDQYLSQIIQQNLGLYSTMAAAVLSGRQNTSKNLVEAPTSTVADKVAGIGSIPINQDNSDPRLMAGVGNMPTTPRDSVDTPMTGVAQLPAKQMMAEGGIVGYQEGGEVEPATFFGEGSDKLRYIRENPFEAASYGLLAVPGAGLAGLGLRAAGRYALPKIASGARKLFTRPGKRELAGFQAYREGPRTLRKLRTLGTASGVAGLGGLAATADFDSDEPPVEESKVDPNKVDQATSSMFPPGFMNRIYRQAQLTGKNVAEDKSGQGLAGSILGGYAKSVGDLAAADEKTENKIREIGAMGDIKSLLSQKITPNLMFKINKEIQDRADNNEFKLSAKQALESGEASKLKTELLSEGIAVGSGEEGLLKALEEYYKLLAKDDLLTSVIGSSRPAPAGFPNFSIEKVT